MVHFSRDVLEPLPVSVALDEQAAHRRWDSKENFARALWKGASRLREKISRGRHQREGLLVRDETYWRWWVEDNYGFWGKPKHCTWEQFDEELRSFSLHIELHPTKPEDYMIMHLLRKDTDGSTFVAWSAEHAVWQGPALMDLYASAGTMMTRRLKTRTLSFDNGRGTISEFNLQHVGPYTTAIQINARPPYYYDPYLREKREEFSSWYFTKDLLQNPGIDEEGTVSFYTSAEALTYHLSAAVNSLLRRNIHSFYSRGRRRTAEHHNDTTPEWVKARSAATGWLGFGDVRDSALPATTAIDAVTDHWLEESPFPLTTVNSRVRKLARLRAQNLESSQFVHGNVTLTKNAALSAVETYAPSLLTDSEGYNSKLADMLDPPPLVDRAAVYVPLSDAQLEKLAELRAQDAQRLLEAAKEEEEREEKGRKRAAKRVSEGETGESAADSEQWEWLRNLAEEDSKIVAQAKEKTPGTGDDSLGTVTLA